MTSIKAKVKSQYPKTLEEAIKSAQIFDDMFDKRVKVKSTQSEHASNKFAPCK